ncbi:DUF3107 domain-containing protein [Rothia sp. P6271]|uniref:DUF3107 domain-containing protein n=1 Tax=unclassified Rothia (in: high G+C Gram-positive bacteria) TaxID=2689056 RepID=UPI003AD09647
MDVKFGIRNMPREVVIESDKDPVELRQLIARAMDKGEVLELEDDKGNVVLIPGDKIGFVEIGSETKRRVGFNFSA